MIMMFLPSFFYYMLAEMPKTFRLSLPTRWKFSSEECLFLKCEQGLKAPEEMR